MEQRVRERTRELLDSNQYLKESETKIATIVDNIADGVITVDSFGVIESSNLAALQIFGYSSTELVGKSFSTLFPGQETNRTSKLEFNAQAQETTAIAKDGKQFPIEYSVSKMCLNNKTLYIFVLRDITELKATIEKLQHIANHDTLTGLYNRSYLDDVLERTIARVKRGISESCAILYIDLDNFKYVNDTLGHAAGDRVLTDVTRIMKRRARTSDILCRLGGDEFAALIFNANAKTAKEIADTFREKIADYIFQDGHVKVDVGCSIGISIITKDCTSADEELARADYACYQAKRSGRNCVCMFDQGDKTHISTMSLDRSWLRNTRSTKEKDGFKK